MKQVLIIIASVVVGVGALSLGFTYVQVQQERLALSADLQYRTRLLGDSLKESVEPAFASDSKKLEKIVTAFTGRERLIGVAVYDATSTRIAGSAGVSENLIRDSKLVARAIERNETVGDYVTSGSKKMYVLAEPLQPDGGAKGAFVVVQDADYIDTSVEGVWSGNLLNVLAYFILFALAIAALIRWVIFKPLNTLVESIQFARSGRAQSAESSKHNFFFRPLASEIGKLAHNLTQARHAASEEARMRLEKIDSPWTAERLKEFTKAYLRNRSIIVVSSRGPYIQESTDAGVQYTDVAGGMTTALKSVMETCGGMWVARASSAEKKIARNQDMVPVPSDEPKYMLKHVWLTDRELDGHYSFSAEALYPLCLITHTRPVFKKEDWEQYRKVNGKFAESILREIANLQRPLILVNDYHFALLPQMLKKSRPDASVGLFWHVPWPNEESFSICPWRTELLEGMLGADIIGFNTQQFCNNFMDTVQKEIESLIEWEEFSVNHDGHRTYIKPFPVSIAFTNGNGNTDTAPDRSALVRLGINSKFLGLGVDRLDYAKGIPERFKAIESFFTMYPQYVGEFTFLQIASPHREHIETYRVYKDIVTKEAERINRKFGRDAWRPIVLEKIQYSHEQLVSLYRLADVCLVTSLHDSMNLVAKEYVAERDKESGALVISQFAGASRDLKGALVVNPYSAENVADAIHTALIMSPTEQHRRMRAMRNSIKDYNVYRWAAELLKAIANTT